MSIIIDINYVGLVGSRLERFKQVRARLWVARCPICGDSQKKLTKKRFYIYQNHKDGSADYLSVACHNCGYGNPFGKFLEEFDPGMYKEYRLEQFKERSGVNQYTPPSQPTTPIQSTPVAPVEPTPTAIVIPDRLNLPTINQLPDGHPAKDYVISRKLPLWTHDLLMYTDNFKESFTDFSIEASLMQLPDDPRLVIPFYDESGTLKVVQGRALNPKSSLRYISLKKNETDNKVFGLDRVDRSRTVLVVEGPLDSLFLPNTLAAADADLLSVDADIYIFDFEPRNKEIMKRLLNAIEKGKRVVIPPDNYIHKDINDCAKDGGLSSRDLVQFIGKHCYQGLAARMRFSKYCSIKL